MRPRRLLGCYRYVRLRWRLLFAAIDCLGWLLFGPARLLGRAAKLVRPAASSTSPNPEDIKRILVIQLDHLGDAVLSTGFLASLAAVYPAARLDVLAAPWNAAVFRMCPGVRRVRVLHRNRFAAGGGWNWIAALVRCAWHLRRCRYDVAIDVRGEFPHALLMWLAGARHRIGWNCGGGGFLLTQSAAFHRGRHEVLSRLALLRLLVSATEDDVAPRIRPAAKAVASVQRRLNEVGLPIAAATEPDARSGPLVVMHVGSGTQAKRWPAWHWRELLGRLIVTHNAQVVLVGVASEAHVSRQVLAGGALNNVVDWTGQLSLAELAALLARCDLFIGADSGPAHLAAAVGARTVAIFSGTNHPHQWAPWGRAVSLLCRPPACSPCHRQQCALADHPCMVGVQPGEVAAIAADHLQAAGFAAQVDFSHEASPVLVQLGDPGNSGRRRNSPDRSARADQHTVMGSKPAGTLGQEPAELEILQPIVSAFEPGGPDGQTPADAIPHDVSPSPPSTPDGKPRVYRVDGPHRIHRRAYQGRLMASDLPQRPEAGISHDNQEHGSV